MLLDHLLTTRVFQEFCFLKIDRAPSLFFFIISIFICFIIITIFINLGYFLKLLISFADFDDIQLKLGSLFSNKYQSLYHRPFIFTGPRIWCFSTIMIIVLTISIIRPIQGQGMQFLNYFCKHVFM